MKRIINGKRYDTETADEVASWQNSFNQGDFNWCAEELYKTKKGAYFIAGEGGPLSKYAQQCGSGTSGGESIRPVDEDNAFAWLQETRNIDAIEKHFPDRVEDA